MHSLKTIQTLALFAQGLHEQPKAKVDGQLVLNLIKKIGCIQIDTLQMVMRSQYLVLWSRIGNYDVSVLNELLFPKKKTEHKLFEYWLHCASIIPFEYYRFRLNKMHGYQVDGDRWNKEWLAQEENQNLMAEIIRSVAENGSVQARDFVNKEKMKSGWWNWKPAKKALEQLYNRGDLMIQNRKNFNRVYDIKERVIPKNINTIKPDLEDEYMFWLNLSAKSLGVFYPMQIADYTYMKRTVAKKYIEKLLKTNQLIEIIGETHKGLNQKLLIHKENLNVLEQISDSEITANLTTFLSPFDNLFWAKKRDMQFWNFNQVLEAYKKKEDRKWGYFCLAILHESNIIGRFDPKLDRESNTLIIQALYLNETVLCTDKMISSVSTAMIDFLQFHNATSIQIKKSSPKSFGEKLLENIQKSIIIHH